MVQYYIQTVRQFFSARGVHNLRLLNNFDIPAAVCGQSRKAQRISIHPHAVLDIMHRRGRSWGLLTSYEEKRLGLK